MMKMLKNLLKSIKGNSTNLHQNLIKYDLYPNQVKRFYKSKRETKIIFVTKSGTVVLKNILS